MPTAIVLPVKQIVLLPWDDEALCSSQKVFLNQPSPKVLALTCQDKLSA